VLEYTAYIIWGLSGIYVFIILCMYTNIRMSIAILRASASFVSGNLSTIFIPLFSLLFALVFICAWMVAAIYLFSVGEIVGETGGNQYRSVQWSTTTRYLVVYLIFGFLWVAALILACNFFVLAATTCTWYFTSTSDSRGKVNLG
jgi:hypothetical protein